MRVAVFGSECDPKTCCNEHLVCATIGPTVAPVAVSGAGIDPQSACTDPRAAAPQGAP